MRTTLTVALAIVFVATTALLYRRVRTPGRRPDETGADGG